jgi:hypothetical protein
VDTLPTSDIPVEVAIAGGLVYVATKSGLDIIDVSDPDNPVPIGQTAPPFMARGVTVDGDIAYVSDRESQIHIIDIRAPSAPATWASIDVPGFPNQIVDASDMIYVISYGQFYITPAQCPLGLSGDGLLPTASSLQLDVYPNPFNPRTIISFTLANDSPVLLTVHDVRGRLVRTLLDGPLAAGRQELVWDGMDNQQRSLASGIYFTRLTAGESQQVSRLVLVR